VIGKERLKLHVGVIDEATVGAALSESDEGLEGTSELLLAVATGSTQDEIGHYQAHARVIVLQRLH
jgi:hypothetical protein